jgi:hypothetical protein
VQLTDHELAAVHVTAQHIPVAVCKQDSPAVTHGSPS